VASIIQPDSEKPFVSVVADTDKSLLSIDESAVISNHKKHGAILFRGFDLDVEAFGEFATKYCIGSAFNESGNRLLLDAENNIQTVNGSPYALPLHAEMSRDPWMPDVCFFGCTGPPTEGGETLICDGIEIVDNMEQALFDAFESRRLLHAQFSTPATCEYWLGTSDPDDSTLFNPPESCPYDFARVDGRIIHSFSRPALFEPMFSDELTFSNFLIFSRYQNQSRSFPVFENKEIIPDDLVAEVKAISDTISVSVKWQQDDVVMLDNTRFMHARNAVQDTDERLIMTYFGYLKFAEPSEEEPVNARWRQPGFRPPHVSSGLTEGY
jgi:alpha-ketoglutarate-dependent taurine dioxygenase